MDKINLLGLQINVEPGKAYLLYFAILGGLFVLKNFFFLNKMSNIHPSFHPSIHPSIPRSLSDSPTTSGGFDVKEHQCYSELPSDVWALYLVTKAELSHPTEETHFICLYLFLISFFWPLPKACVLRWGLQHWSAGKSKSMPSSLAPSSLSSAKHPHFCWCGRKLRVYLTLPSLMNKWQNHNLK